MCGRTLRQKRAYSLAEVLLAVWLLTFIGGALIATFTYLSKASAVSADQAGAELLASEILETARNSGPPNWGQTALTGTYTLGEASKSQGQMNWTLEPTKVEESSMGSLYQLKVSISWAEFKDGVERGKRTLERTRYLYMDDI